MSAKDLQDKLTQEQFEVTQNSATEPAFSGIYVDEKRPGTYCCVCCKKPLFNSNTKYDSGSGWPSFWEPVAADSVTSRTDSSHGMVRTEVCCGSCGAHLGHVFPDGPQPTGARYCINSAALDLEVDKD